MIYSFTGFSNPYPREAETARTASSNISFISLLGHFWLHAKLIDCLVVDVVLNNVDIGVIEEVAVMNPDIALVVLVEIVVVMVAGV